MNRNRKVLTKLIAAGALLFVIAGCQTTASNNQDANAFTQISDDQIAVLYGDKLEINDNFIVIDPDGTFSGSWSDALITGTWEMREDYWCRTLTKFHDASRIGQEDCQLLEVSADGSSVRGTRNKGEGSQFTYAVN